MSELARLKLRIDKRKVAELIGADLSSLITLPNPSRVDMFTFGYQCDHGGNQFWLDNGDVNPKWMPVMMIQMNVLFDEDNLCYGVAGVCRCGRSYFMAPTVALLEFLDAESQRLSRKLPR